MKRPVLLTVAVLCLIAFSGPVARAQYGPAVAAFCQRKLEKRVAGGECAHLATEALRVAGAEFLRSGAPDAPGKGDYVWGKFVKEVIGAGNGGQDKNPNARCQVGDILQLRDAKFANGRSSPHHTAIVATVDAKGYPTEVYEQNTNNRRLVTRAPMNILQLTNGWVRAYRPVAPVFRNRFEFSLTNNSKSETVAFTLFNREMTLGASNTQSGYRTIWGAGALPRLILDGRIYVLKHRTSYEFYTTGEKLRLREWR